MVVNGAVRYGEPAFWNVLGDEYRGVEPETAMFTEERHAKYVGEVGERNLFELDFLQDVIRYVGPLFPGVLGNQDDRVVSRMLSDTGKTFLHKKGSLRFSLPPADENRG